MIKGTESDKALKDKVFKIAINSNYNGYERGLASMVYNVFDKNFKGSSVKSMSNQQLADKLHKQILRKFKRHKAYSFKGNI